MSLLNLPLRVIDAIEVGSGGASSVQFVEIDKKASVIKPTPKHLVLLASARGDSAETTLGSYIQFNGDTGANYNGELLYGYGTTDTAIRKDSQNFLDALVWRNIPSGNAPTDSFGGGLALIPEFDNTARHKLGLQVGGAAEERVVVGFGRWASTSAITSIKWTASGGDFVAGSRFLLCVVDEKYNIASSQLSVDGTFDFQSLPQVQGDLAGVGVLRSDKASQTDSANIELNGDTTDGNYAIQQLVGDEGSTAAASASQRKFIGEITGDNGEANVFGALALSISAYAGNHADPHVLTFSGHHQGSATADGYVNITSGRRNNIAAINRLSLNPRGGTNFKAGSRMDLYLVPKRTLNRQKLDATTATVTFDGSLESFYEALVGSVYSQHDGASGDINLLGEYNNDTTNTNYASQTLNGVGSGVSANQHLTSDNTSAAKRLTVISPGADADIFEGGYFMLPAPGKTDRHKHNLVETGWGSSAAVGLRSGRWADTQAIDEIDLSPDSADSLEADSVLSLEGILPRGGPPPSSGLRIG